MIKTYDSIELLNDFIEPQTLLIYVKPVVQVNKLKMKIEKYKLFLSQDALLSD